MKDTNNFQTSNAEMVTISRAEYERFQAQSQRISELEQQVAVLMEAIRLARHKQFGAPSEKISEDAMEQLSFLFNEAEVYAEEKAEDEPVTVVAAHKRHKKHQYHWRTSPRVRLRKL
ncbi:MAG: transposase [Faecousia sp.]